MKKRGFALIELLVVAAVLSVLVLLALPWYSGKAEIAQERRIQNDIRAVESVYEFGWLKSPNLHQELPEVDLVDLVSAAIEGRLYAKDGLVSVLPVGDLRVLPVEISREEGGSRLPGVFYSDEFGRGYYVHTKGSGDAKVSLLPEEFESEAIDLAPFVYWQEQVKEAGSSLTSEELKEKYVQIYFEETDGDYTVRPGKEAELQLLEEGMRAMLEEAIFERHTEVEAVIRRDFSDPCVIDYAPSPDGYNRIITLRAAQGTGFSNMVYHKWNSEMETYEKESDLGWIKFVHPANPNVYLSVRRTSTTSRITYELVSSSNQRRTILLNNTGTGYLWYATTYVNWTLNGAGDYVLSVQSNSGSSMGTYAIPSDNLPCQLRPPSPIRPESALATGQAMQQPSNTAIVDYFKNQNMTTQQKIDAINGRSGAGHPHFVFAMIG